MTNAANDDPGRVRPVEDHVRVLNYHEAAETALVDDASAVWMVREQLNDALYRPLTFSAPLGDRPSMHSRTSVTGRNAQRV
jgi:hypothetical protein